VRGPAGVRHGPLLERAPAAIRGSPPGDDGRLRLPPGLWRPEARGGPAHSARRPAPGDRDNRPEPSHPLLAPAVLDAARPPLPAPVLAGPVPARRRAAGLG